MQRLVIALWLLSAIGWGAFAMIAQQASQNPLPLGTAITTSGTSVPGESAPDLKFDVKPVVVDKWEPPLPEKVQVLQWAGICPIAATGEMIEEGVCLDDGFHRHIHSRTCKDKARFLIEDSGGQWHCLDLLTFAAAEKSGYFNK